MNCAISVVIPPMVTLETIIIYVYCYRTSGQKHSKKVLFSFVAMPDRKLKLLNDFGWGMFNLSACIPDLSPWRLPFLHSKSLHGGHRFNDDDDLKNIQKLFFLCFTFSCLKTQPSNLLKKKRHSKTCVYGKCLGKRVEKVRDVHFC